MEGTRKTSQMLKILEYLKSTKSHPTAEEVYQEVRKELPAISLATVYRNLNKMAEQGMISKMQFGSEARYDADICCHQHCICRKCGRIIDVFHKEISEFALKKAKSNEFHPECAAIIFKGVCKKCRCGCSKS